MSDSHPLLDEYDRLGVAITESGVISDTLRLIAQRERLRLGIITALKIADVMERANR